MTVAMFFLASCCSDDNVERRLTNTQKEIVVAGTEVLGYDGCYDSESVPTAIFAYADATTLRIQGYYVKAPDGWINYQRGPSEPSF